MKWIGLSSALLFTYFQVFSQCDGGTNAGTLTPSTGDQTQTVSNGEYYVIDTECGQTYTFTFCSGGGNASWDTQITINDVDNTSDLAYNDDACGLQSEVSYTSTSGETIHVLITQYNCILDDSQTGTLSYSYTPQITYSASCTSAFATINDGSAGSFAFSPDPGDGATIDATTGEIANGTEGASYTVAYTSVCGTENYTVNMTTSPCYNMSGDATTISVDTDGDGTPDEQCIQLTAATNDETGCAWSEESVDFASDFSLSLDYYFGDDPNGADGSTFTFQPDANASCGSAGAQLGAGGIPNALIIEFDTYDNDGAEGNDESCDHIALETDSDLPDDPINFPANEAPYCGPECAIDGGGAIEDGATHEVEIVWNAASQTMEIYFDGVMQLSCSGDFVTDVFGGQSEVYWGATAATGGLNNQQYFCPSTVVVLGADILSFDVECENDKLLAKWETVQEENLNYFSLEYTYDGFVYYPYKKINATGGNTETNQRYQLEIQNNNSKKTYYRLKMVDYDGAISYSSLRFSEECNNSQEIMASYTDGAIVLFSNENKFTYKVLNAAGQLVCSGATQTGIIKHKQALRNGVYFVQVVYPSQEHVFKRILVY